VLCRTAGSYTLSQHGCGAPELLVFQGCGTARASEDQIRIRRPERTSDGGDQGKIRQMPAEVRRRQWCCSKRSLGGIRLCDRVSSLTKARSGDSWTRKLNNEMVNLATSSRVLQAENSMLRQRRWSTEERTTELGSGGHNESSD
jgi:hypothetical protein